MQVVVLREPGRAENLKLEEVPDPAPGAGDVVVRLKAAALNHRIEERVDTSFTAEGIFSAFDLEQNPIRLTLPWLGAGS